MLPLNFRTKLILAMMLLVIGVTSATLLITGNQLRVSYERHFQQYFNFQIESFLEQRNRRLAQVERAEDYASSPRLLAAMENAGSAGSEQQDVDDLYKNGVDELGEIVQPLRSESRNLQPGFFFFLTGRGEILYPSSKVRLPFFFPDLRRITNQVASVGRAVGRSGSQQVGYLAPQDALGNVRIREMVFTTIVDRVSRQNLGVLAVGVALLETEGQAPPPHPASSSRPLHDGTLAGMLGAAKPGGTILSGVWLDNQLYSSSIPAEALPPLEQDLARQLRTGQQTRNDFVVELQGVPHQVYCQALTLGSAFPPAYEVCLYSLAEAQAQKQASQRKILFSGTVALLGALVMSLLISHGMAVPVRELVSGTAKLEQGNYAVQVPVRSGDEIGRLAQAFNQMTQRLQAAHNAQEQRIAERTQELAQRKLAEAALRRSETSLREAQRIAHLGNWQWHLATNELQWSDEIYSIFGLTQSQFAATYEAFLDRVHPADRERVVQALRLAAEAGTACSLDHRLLRPDGEVRIVHQRAEVLRDDHGRIVGLVGTVQDISEQKRIEAEFLRAQRLDSIGALAGGIAHDLNNALSPILMGIQLIRRQLLDPETQQMLTVMEANTHRGAEMVRQVLTFARGRDGERELLNVGALVREMENILRQTLPKSVAVAAMVPNDLWPILGNATQFHQVLLNLCTNARDAMPKGGQLMLAADNVELSPEETQGIADATPGSYVMLLVSDTGTGIAPEVLPHIFEPFFTTKGPTKGTGLGLSTIARIVRNLGGFVSVKSQVGEGTTFEIYCPRAQPAPVPEILPPTQPASLPLGQGELILFIDDDRSIREVVVPTLTEHGYRVLSAGNGAEALALLRQHETDLRLVLTDLAMPVLDGMAMLQAVCARYPTLPVILMSGELDTVREQAPAGAAAVLLKPFRLEQLLLTISQTLHPPTPAS